MWTDDNGFLKVHIHIYDNGEEKKMPFQNYVQIFLKLKINVQKIFVQVNNGRGFWKVL